MVTVAEIFREMHKHFNPQAAAGVTAVFQFNISGPAGGIFAFAIENGACNFQETAHPSPSVEIAMSDEDWKAIREGRMNSQMAFMQGKLKVKGDMGLAMKLQQLFPLGS